MIGPIRMEYPKGSTVLENVGKALEELVNGRQKDKKDNDHERKEE